MNFHAHITQSADGSTKYSNESESREMTFYGGSKTVPPVSINVKGEALRGIWGVSGGLSTGGSPEFFKKWNTRKQICLLQRDWWNGLFLCLGYHMVYITNHQFKQVLLWKKPLHIVDTSCLFCKFHYRILAMIWYDLICFTFVTYMYEFYLNKKRSAINSKIFCLTFASSL